MGNFWEDYAEQEKDKVAEEKKLHFKVVTKNGNTIEVTDQSAMKVNGNIPEAFKKALAEAKTAQPSPVVNFDKPQKVWGNQSSTQCTNCKGEVKPTDNGCDICGKGYISGTSQGASVSSAYRCSQPDRNGDVWPRLDNPYVKKGTFEFKASDLAGQVPIEKFPMGASSNPMFGSSFVFVKENRFLINVADRPNLTNFIKAFEADYHEKTLDIEAYETVDGTCHDFIMGGFRGASLITQTILDGCGNVLFNIEFSALRLCGHKVKYDYAKGGVPVHHMKLTFEFMKRIPGSASIS